MEEKEVVVEKVFDLFLFICSLQMNKKTKIPSVNIKQEQAMEILGQLNDIANLYGKNIVMYEEAGEKLIKTEDI